MAEIEVAKDGYTILTGAEHINIDAVHAYLHRSYWAAGIPKAVVEKSIANSLCFGVFNNGVQVGFARLVTDKATFAYLADVYILEEHRGKGLSKWLMATIHAHPELQMLRRWLLGTKDAHSLYEQFGWEHFTAEGCSRIMQRYNPNIYQQNAAV